jgi:uncharacterized protein YjaG (DUF416 family)
MIDLKQEATEGLRKTIAILKAEEEVKQAAVNYLEKIEALNEAMASIEAYPEFAQWLAVARVKASVIDKRVVGRAE